MTDNTTQRHVRRRGTKYLAFGTVAAMTVTGAVAGITAASADVQDPDGAVSAAHGHGLYLEALGLGLIGSAESNSEFPSDVGPNSEPLNFELLSAFTVDLGTVNVPLIGDGANGGLLHLGDLGVLSSYAASKSLANSVASSGVITADGGLDIGAGTDANFERAKLDLSGVLRQLLSDTLVDTVLDEASISVGAVASRAEADSGIPTSEYMLTGLGVDVHSPLVGGLVNDVDGALGTLLTPINGLLAPGGGIETLVRGVVNSIGALPLVNASLNDLSLDTTPLTDAVRAGLLQTPLENAEQSLSVDLSTGVIHVDLDEIVVDRTGGASLSTLDANTEVLDDATINAILDGVSDALIGAGPNSLVSKVIDIVTESIYNLELNVSIEADISTPSVPPLIPELPLVKAPVTLHSTIGGLLGMTGHDAPVIDTSQINVAGIPVGAVLQPIVNLLKGLVTSIGGVLEPVVDGLLDNLQPALMATVSPIVTNLLDNALEPVLKQLLAVTINEQPTAAPTNTAGGDLGPDSFTVRALSVTILPLLNDAVKLEIGSSTVMSVIEVVQEATLSATDAEQGGTVTLTGTNFVPGEDVVINLPDGTTTTVVAEPDGTISYDWSVPETQAPGTVTYTATGDSGRTATTDAEITLAVATLTASPNPVEPGATVTLIGSNFIPGETVTIIGGAECLGSGGATGNADQDGNISLFCTVDAGTPDGTQLVFTATGEDSGRTATAETEVVADAPADANTNASASAAASAQADGDNQAAAQVAAQAAAMADATTTSSAAADADASAAAEAAARDSVDAGASVDASSTATTNASASAQVAAQANATTTASANADASASGSVTGSVDSRAASQASAEASADADSSGTASQEASANVNADANASASASASANANNNNDAAAQAAAEAAAYAAADSDASAAANADASAAAEAAAHADVDADASATASADSAPDANAAAVAAANANANNDATADASATANASASANEDANTAADFDAASAARAAARNAATSDSNADADASATASASAAADVQANANASASASASADADSHSNPAAQAAAIAAAMADNSNDADAAADNNAEAAAQAAARQNVDADASANASQNADSSAQVAAQSTADVDSAQAADQSAAADVNAEASAQAAAEATASTDASSLAAADVNAAASASASAEADSNANAAAEAASETSAMADATTTATAEATAAATANAEAAAQAAAETAARAQVRAQASANASQDTSADANVAAQATAQASADHSADANVAAEADASTTATANAEAASEAAAQVAANAASTADASATASATALASAKADASATASAAAEASVKGAAQGAANASGAKLAETGSMIGGVSALALMLLLGGAVTAVIAARKGRATVG